MYLTTLCVVPVCLQVEAEAKAAGKGPFQVDGSTKAETEVKTFGREYCWRLAGLHIVLPVQSVELSLSLSLSAPGTPARLCAAPICVLGWPTRCLFAAATGIADANAKVTPGSISASSATHSSSLPGGKSKVLSACPALICVVECSADVGSWLNAART